MSWSRVRPLLALRILGHIGVELTADQQAALKEKIAESKKRKLGPPPSLPASQGDLEAVGNPPARRHGRPGGAGCQLRRERQGCAKAEKPLAQEYTCAARWQARRWSLGCRPGGFTQSWRVGFFRVQFFFAPFFFFSLFFFSLFGV